MSMPCSTASTAPTQTRSHGAPGFGLGLSIVAAVADAHHAQIRAEALPDGGLTVTVDFPAALGPGTTTASEEPGMGRVSV